MLILIQNITKKYWLAISSFILFEIFLIAFFIANKNEKIDAYLSSLQQTYLIQFDTISQGYNNLAQNTFFGIINKPQIIDPIKNSFKKDPEIKKHYRDILFKEFSADYERLKQYQFEQVQFQFPDNTSFLRMHKPDFYDDNLTNVRDGVMKVNSLLKPISGFEIGKIVYGFRYLFPIFDENLFHIGSVELTIPVSNYMYNFEKVFQLDAHFLINKRLVNNRMGTSLSKQFNESIEDQDYFISTLSKQNKTLFNEHNLYNVAEIKMIKKNIREHKNFIFSKQIQNRYYSISFINIPCIDESNKCAYLVLYKESPYIDQTYENFEKIMVILMFVFFAFLFVIFKNYTIDTKNAKRQEVLSQQSKLASMGEMINNIAHQWRQPLAVISAASSGMKVQHEYGLLKEEKLIENLDLIFKNTQFLSQTIEDFRNFFKTEKEESFFAIDEAIRQVVNIFSDSFKADNIEIIINGSVPSINSFQNEFKQVVINLLKNAKDAIGKDGLILITITEQNDEITISFQDSGKGISDPLKEKIFDPYFTTKHQSQGTGLGLYMTHEIIQNDLGGVIMVENNSFEYNFKHYYGANFKIILNRRII